MSLATRRKLQPYLYIAPVLIVLLLMFGYPLIKSIVMSFQDYKLSRLDKVAWNNFKNYKKMFSDRNFRLLFKNSGNACLSHFLFNSERVIKQHFISAHRKKCWRKPFICSVNR